jgi:hypothetical protein
MNSDESVVMKKAKAKAKAQSAIIATNFEEASVVGEADWFTVMMSYFMLLRAFSSVSLLVDGRTFTTL